MTSAINTTQIDEEYPVAGADNNSQGFRDNFTGIKTALNVAAGEITTLQNTTAKLNDDNNFDSNSINNAIYYNLRGKVNTSQEADGDGVELNVSQFPMHWVNVTAASPTITVIGWPGPNILNQYACVRIEIRGGYVGTASVSFSSNPSTTEVYDTDFPSPFEVAQNEIHVVEVWTYNRTEKVFFKYLGKFA